MHNNILKALHLLMMYMPPLHLLMMCNASLFCRLYKSLRVKVDLSVLKISVSSTLGIPPAAQTEAMIQLALMRDQEAQGAVHGITPRDIGDTSHAAGPNGDPAEEDAVEDGADGNALGRTM